MKKSRFLALLMALIMVVGIFAACAQEPEPDAPDPDAPAPVGETHLMVVQPMMPSSFDPVMVAEIPAARSNYLIFQTLVYQDMDGNIIPGLAHSWEFTAPDTVVFNLREGVLFHNGYVLTADDVVFSLMRASVSPPVSVVTSVIYEVVAITDHQVSVRTEFPFVPILAHLSQGSTSIVSRAVVEAIGDEEHGRNPIGTGPFKFEYQVIGDRYVLSRFEEFNSHVPGLPDGQLPAVERITFRVVPEGGVRTIELETGTSHIVVDVATTDVVRIREHPDLTMYEIPNLAVNTWLGFNNLNAPFDDIRVRQAIAYAIDVPTIVDVAWAGLGSVADAPVPETIRGHTPFQVRQQNIERARELMAEAGLEDGFTTNVWTNEGNPMRADAAVMIQAQLRALNIETSIHIYEWGVLLPGTAAGEHDMWLGGWTTTTGDIDYGLYPLFYTGNWGEAGNRFFYSDPRVDELIMQARAETNDSARMALYSEVQALIMADTPHVPLWQGVELHAARHYIGGLYITPGGMLSLWTVYFE
jgi:peptide/nickel transport system substrate-binding protein